MSVPTTPVHAPYFGRLDAIRGIAILWVVCYHFIGATCGWDAKQWEQGWENSTPWLAIAGPAFVRLLGMGALGVPMFFVLSGFLIHYTHSRSTDQRVSLFWFRRWGRIYPPYLVALVAFALWQDALWNARGRTNFFTHLLLVHNFHDRTLFGINASFWSLAHEAQFYFLYPFLLRLRQAIGMLPLLIGSLIVRLGISAWVQSNPEQFESDPAMALMLPRLYFEWILGMYVADCFLLGKRALPWGTKVAGLCAVYCYFACREPGWEIGVVPAVAVATAIWVEQIIHQRREAWLIERALIPLGVISYSVYLWHQPIVNHLSQRIMNSSHPVPWIGRPGQLVVAFVLCGLASAIVGTGAYRLFEVPAIDFVKRWSQRWKTSSPSIACEFPGIRTDEPDAQGVPAPTGWRLIARRQPHGRRPA